MLNLFENYLEEEQDLHESLKNSGYKHTTVALTDEGYLPEDVTSPISFFTQMNSTPQKRKNSPKFFNEVAVPYYWEIKGDGQKAEIFDGYKKKGTIVYSQRRGDYRAVKAVEWLNEQEKVRSIDLYNQHGTLFGKKNYSDGQLALTTYFNSQRQEVLLFNHVTGTIQVNYQGKKYIFEKFNDFIIFYFKVAKLDDTQIFYNSLATPFFIVDALQEKNPQKSYHHTLFWQETSTEIPGNMKHLLEDKETPTKQIVVQDREEYLRIKEQIYGNIETKVKVDYLGYIYNLKARPIVDKSILIVTNSDQIEKLDDLVKALPNHKFAIAARTTMSERLLAYDHYQNVTLYPTVEEEEIAMLLEKNSFYLDVNYGNEVDQIIRKAFENNQLIFAFKETLHSQRYIYQENIFDANHVEQLVKAIERVSQNAKEYRKYLGSQWWTAGQSTAENYKDILK